jgi:hypothetical protein
LGDRPVVAFFLLLCTAEANASHCVQSSGTVEVTSLKYCLIHWFFCLDSPSICGWNAMDMFCSIPNFVVSALLKWDVNHGSLSLMIFVGNPNHWNMLLWYNWAIPGPVMVVLHGRNTAALEHPWSTIVSIMSFLCIDGSPMIRSMVTLWNGQAFSSVGIW